MTTIVFDDIELGTAPIPNGVTPGPYCFRLKKPSGSLVKFIRTESLTPSFAGIDPGSYILTAQREGTNQEPIGEEFSKPIEVPDLTPRTEVPIDVTVSFAP